MVESLVTGGGGLALLVGILLLKTAGGSLSLSDWMAYDQQIRQHPLYGAIFATMLLGAMTKSAQVPFHFWLPNAMSAPTPISAFMRTSPTLSTTAASATFRSSNAVTLNELLVARMNDAATTTLAVVEDGLRNIIRRDGDFFATLHIRDAA